MPSLSLTSAPSVEPVLVADLTPDLGYGAATALDSTTLAVVTAKIQPKIIAARQFFENLLRRSLITQTWTLKLDGWPGYDPIYSREGYPAIVLPMPPFRSMVSLQYIDVAGVLQTLPATDSAGISSGYAYQLDPGSEMAPARLIAPWVLPWPPTRRIPNNVIVEWVAGYGDTAASVPEAIKSAIKAYAIQLYNGCMDAPDLTAISFYRNY